VVLVAEDQLQRVLAGGEAHLRFGLAGAEIETFFTDDRTSFW
jgi:hypothetical protein